MILQSENKMKACLGRGLGVSLPKAYQNQTKNGTLVVKGVPTEFNDAEFKQVLGRNKINHPGLGVWWVDATAENCKCFDSN